MTATDDRHANFQTCQNLAQVRHALSTVILRLQAQASLAHVKSRSCPGLAVQLHQLLADFELHSGSPQT